MSVVETAPAKINLFLHVAPPRPDGYHDLFSYAAFADVGDVLHVEADDHDLVLDVTGPFAGSLAGEAVRSNLIWRATEALAAHIGRPATAHITLDKHLPVASGVGGGSADAAAALRALMRLWGVRPDPAALTAMALELGADVPVCLASAPAYMRGVGEDLSPAPRIDAGVLLANPLQATPTGAIFRAYDAAGRFTPIDVSAPGPKAALDAASLAALMADTRNDLQEPAVAHVPEIAETLRALQDCDDVRAVRMSGSGATCFAVFDDAQAASRAAETLKAARADWWIAAGSFTR